MRHLKKLLYGLLIVAFLGACSDHYCPTYATAKGPRAYSASMKKPKVSKPKSAGYKKAKQAQAESD